MAEVRGCAKKRPLWTIQENIGRGQVAGNGAWHMRPCSSHARPDVGYANKGANDVLPTEDTSPPGHPKAETKSLKLDAFLPCSRVRRNGELALPRCHETVGALEFQS